MKIVGIFFDKDSIFCFYETIKNKEYAASI